VSAEASYVGRETARRCNWPVERTQGKVVLTGTDGAVTTGMATVPIQVRDRTIERLQLFVSPHVNDSLTLGRDVVTRISVREGRLLLTLYDGEVVDTLAEEPFRLLFDATYIEEEEAEQLNDVHGMENATRIEQSRKTPEQCAAPSIFEDSAFIPVGESLQQFGGVESRIWSIDQGALPDRSDEDQDEVTNSNISSLVSEGYERSKDSVARSARTQGEVLFGGAESVDEWMDPSPVLGVVAESADGLTTPPPHLQLERNQLGVSLESTDGKMTPTRGELMEMSGFEEAPPFNGVLYTVEGHPRQPQKVLRKRICKVQKVLCKNIYSKLQEIPQDGICSQLQIVLKSRLLLYRSSAHRPRQ